MVKETFSFSMVELVATYSSINNNEIYLLTISVDVDIESRSQLKVVWFS